MKNMKFGDKSCIDMQYLVVLCIWPRQILEMCLYQDLIPLTPEIRIVLQSWQHFHQRVCWKPIIFMVGLSILQLSFPFCIHLIFFVKLNCYLGKWNLPIHFYQNFWKTCLMLLTEMSDKGICWVIPSHFSGRLSSVAGFFVRLSQIYFYQQYLLLIFFGTLNLIYLL